MFFKKISSIFVAFLESTKFNPRSVPIDWNMKPYNLINTNYVKNYVKSLGIFIFCLFQELEFYFPWVGRLILPC